MTITEFLLARIEEDEAGAREAIWARRDLEPLDRRWEYFYPNDRIGVDPAHLLAECEAKRRIVELHFEMDGGAPATFPYTSDDGRTVWPGCAVCHEGSPRRPHCDTVRLLAAVYADHPDYDEAWRP